MGSFITHDFSCLSRVGLLVHDHTDTILSSYTFKSHYLLTESNRAELMKLPMIPSSITYDSFFFVSYQKEYWER